MTTSARWAPTALPDRSVNGTPAHRQLRTGSVTCASVSVLRPCDEAVVQRLLGRLLDRAPQDLVRPVVPDEAFSPAAVNVLDQRRDHHSPLTWMERALRIRKESPELGWGTATVLEVDEPAVLATRIDWEVRTMVTVHNLAREGRQVTLPDPTSTRR